MRTSEQLTVALLVMVVCCFLVDLMLSKPPLTAVIGGLVPRMQRESVYAAVCLLGANIMPHNFYLVSAVNWTTKCSPFYFSDFSGNLTVYG